MKLLYQGAEAKIYSSGNKIIKDRIAKNYRIKEIDDRLRKFRTKREAKILEKLSSLGFTPKIIKQDEHILEIEKIGGRMVRDILETSDYNALCREIGKKVRDMHNQGVIHGDLTTSNMILKEQVYFIDFGLSFFSEKTEDKAVDLHLLRQALESKHYTIFKECFDSVLEGYKDKAVIKRLESVEKRGRNKGKY